MLWGTTVGAVAWDDSRGFATFEFDPEFVKRGLNLAPLTMPLEDALEGRTRFSFPALNKETYRGLPGLLADSLPDTFGNALIGAWLARQGRDMQGFTPVDRLCYTGSRGMGALEYEPALRAGVELSNPVDVENLVHLTREILAERATMRANIHRDLDHGMLEMIRVGSSAGGARAKAVIAYNRESGDVRSGQIDNLAGYECWIIKFDGVTNRLLGDPKGYGRIEFAYSLMARDCGIIMEPCELLEEHGRAHFLTKRFDRVGPNKLHMQTLCAITHADYNDPAGNAYEQAFQVMRRLGVPYTAMEQMFRRMVFNVVARNQDDHTKNISFLMDAEGLWSLAPAYDLTYAYDPANKWMKAHQMSINGKRDGLTRNDLLAVAKQMNIKKPNEAIEAVIEAVSHWPAFAKRAGVPVDQIKVIRKALLKI
jgi:serine/threonine-protein kinase HipA